MDLVYVVIAMVRVSSPRSYQKKLLQRLDEMQRLQQLDTQLGLRRNGITVQNVQVPEAV